MPRFPDDRCKRTNDSLEALPKQSVGVFVIFREAHQRRFQTRDGSRPPDAGDPSGSSTSKGRTTNGTTIDLIGGRKALTLFRGRWWMQEKIR